MRFSKDETVKKSKVEKWNARNTEDSGVSQQKL